ncbi:TonB-dependent receptor [Polaribacter sp. Hel1_85]|uniref:TonB-dependent receptor n=1 Tax=Polaribacter sp. Hel1_85 TaxID=1250005 RepID=UPI00052B6D3E|nr:TonB-dependent receptor [Polaribacter sp. Hel1_85]KGL63474.1 TonB-dependent receptor, plug [Polaribacter sp. Hel1_85]
MKQSILLLFLLISTISFSQNRVTGKVTDTYGEPIPGVSIAIKGTTFGISTDFNGNYQIRTTDANTVLVFSFIGFKEQTITVGDKKIINVQLKESNESLDEVVVKGFSGVIGKSRKRTSSIQITPESVTALNAKGIENAGIIDVSSFSALVPNLKFNTSQEIGLNTITIRGISQVRGGDAPLAFVIDGVTIPDPSLLSQELYDLALIEVVKGPQGALYGKNAIGGAVNIYTKEPTNKMANKIKLGVGNGGQKEVQFISSGALKKDKIFYRFSTQYKDFDGLFTNDFLNEKVDFRTDVNVRGQIKARISNDFSVTGTYQYFDLKGGAAYYAVNPIGFEGEFPGGVMDPNPTNDNNVIVADVLGKSDMKNNYGNIKMEYKFENMSLQSITSFNNVEKTMNGDLDFLDFDLFTQNRVTKTTTFNQEIRLNNKNTDTKFDWSIGGFYQNTEKDLLENGTYESDPYPVADYVNTTETIALFGFADYKLTDKLTASAGFRYDMDKFSQDDTLFETASSRTNNVFQPKASLSYQATKNILFYANYGKGYRTGGYNAQATGLFNREFKDETSENYELGFKTTSWNDRFIFNGSVFTTRMNNQQQYILDLDTFIAGVYNYNDSKFVGFELESRLRLTNFLDAFASYGYTKTEIIDGGKVGGDDGNTTDNTVYNGNKTPFVPVDNFSIGLESSFKINEELKFNGFLNLDTTGETYWHESNRDDFTTAAYSLLGARIGLEYKNWKLDFWGKNLTDKLYYQEFSPGEFVGSPDDVAWRGRPLTVGTSISVKF